MGGKSKTKQEFLFFAFFHPLQSLVPGKTFVSFVIKGLYQEPITWSLRKIWEMKAPSNRLLVILIMRPNSFRMKLSS